MAFVENGLYEIRLKNFKSYDGDHTIGPFLPFQCIIGPNGAGKSNIVDAISFALGVRATHLRGAKLRDLIHKKEDEPETTSKMAHVTLIIRENGKDTSFTRNISAHGVSDYQIDEEGVSQKEYQDALAKINILTKARLSFLVFQGDVESIATKSPSDMTHLFEQVSGSDEFVNEYNRLLAEKEAAEEEMIFQFQKTKGARAEKRQFKEQKEEAEGYQRLLAQQARAVLHYTLFQLYHLQDEIDTRTTEGRQHAGALAKSQEKQATLLEKLRKLKEKQTIEQTKILALERDINKQQQAVESQRPGSVSTKERLSHHKKRVAQLQVQLEKTLQESERHDTLQQTLARDLQQVTTELQALQTLIDNESRNISLSGANLQEYQQLKEKVAADVAEISQQLKHLQRQQDLDTNEKTNKEAKVNELTERKAQANERFDQLLSRATKVEDLRVRTITRIQELETQKRTLESEARNANKTKERLLRTIEEKQGLLHEAKASHVANEREKKMIEMVEDLKRLFPQTVRGRIIELCKPTQDRYKLAVTVAMGRNMDSIVVDDEATAIECIKYLKEQRVGAASFIPLDTIDAPAVQEHLRTISDTVKLVADVLVYPASIKKAILYACGNTVVCETLAEARRLGFESRPRIKVVTVDGILIRKNGTMTGGLTRTLQSSSDRWSQQEVEKVKRDRDRAVNELHELEKGAHREETEKEINSQIRGLETRRGYTENDLQITQQKMDQEKQQIATIDLEIKTLESEIVTITSRIAQRAGEIKKIEEKVNKIEDKIFQSYTTRLGIDNIRVFEKTRLSSIQQKMDQSLELSDRQAKLEHQLQFERQRDINKEVNTLRKDIAETQKELDKLQKEQAKSKNNFDKESSALLEKENSLQALKSKMDELQSEIRAQKRLLDTITNEITSLDKHILSNDAAIERLKMRRHNIYQHCELENIYIPRLDEDDDDDDDDNDTSSQSSQSSQASSSSSSSSRSTRSSRSSSSRMTDDGDEEDETASTSSQALRMRYEKQDRIKIDFTLVTREEKKVKLNSVEYERMKDQFLATIKAVVDKLDKIDPNLKAITHFRDSAERLANSTEEFENAKVAAKAATDAFNATKRKRYAKFMNSFKAIAGKIDEIYKELTASEGNTGGTAHLSCENTEEPYLGGIKFNAMPPGKRFRDMEQLSGGEKTVAALALLFALRTIHPTPFFVLDEVDAALDRPNIVRVASFIVRHSRQMQFIVTSLQDRFFENADALIGVVRDPVSKSSRTLTLDLSPYSRSIN